MADLRDAGGQDLRDDRMSGRGEGRSILPESRATADPWEGLRRKAGPDHQSDAAPPAGGEGPEEPSGDVAAFPEEGERVFRFVGRGGALLRLYVVNLLLTVVTLGVYSFWGRTRVRQYLWSRTLALGEPLEYTGTGWQLFRSFLVVVSLFFGFNVAVTLLSLVSLEASLIAGMVFGTVMMLLWPYAVYCALRFRFSRTCWRGIHGRLTGNPVEYAAQAWVRGMLTVATLGVFAPWARAFLTKFVVDNAFLGTGRFRFRGGTRDLARPYMGCWIMGCLSLIMMVYGFYREAAIMILGVFGLILARFIYRVAYINWIVSGLSIGDAVFRGRLTVPGYVGLCVSNALLVAATLGIFLPWARARRYRYLADHVLIHGRIDWSGIRQDPAPLVKNGEGLLSVLDLDLGF